MPPEAIVVLPLRVIAVSVDDHCGAVPLEVRTVFAAPIARFVNVLAPVA